MPEEMRPGKDLSDEEIIKEISKYAKNVISSRRHLKMGNDNKAVVNENY
ncbi:MAG: hypothetical protein CM1200mP13_13240 [Candidatus Pelagibacterales bacterium]|nr:MAG: hypothetical protein CM1200mP13_13240 [Pelagibacterales bacterium]